MASGEIETRKTFCRFCHVFCGLEVDVQDNKVIAVRGDHDNPVSEGYTCPKGRAEVERINHPERLRVTQKMLMDSLLISKVARPLTKSAIS
jgi:anaerobic selenocysteine-containing dehydrogenase